MTIARSRGRLAAAGACPEPSRLRLAAPDRLRRCSAVHVPVLLVLALSVGHGPGARCWRSSRSPCCSLSPWRRWAAPQRALAASLGLVVCSALLVHLYDGATAAHFHYFVVVAVIALYQDWTVYALAIAFVALEHASRRRALRQHGLRPRRGSAWLFAVLHTAAVLAESGRAGHLLARQRAGAGGGRPAARPAVRGPVERPGAARGDRPDPRRPDRDGVARVPHPAHRHPRRGADAAQAR